MVSVYEKQRYGWWNLSRSRTLWERVKMTEQAANEQPLLSPVSAPGTEISETTQDVESNGKLRKASTQSQRNTWWWQHRQVQEYKVAVIIAWVLLVIGLGLFVAGILAQVRENETVTDIICILVGLFFAIPGAYYAMYAFLTGRGRRGYNMDNVSFFSIGKRNNCCRV